MDFDDNQEDVDKEFIYGGRDGVIFLIDATMPMFIKNENFEMPFQTCLECCKSVMLNKIVGAHRDLFAIIFFGTSKTDNDLKASHVVTFQELSESTADKIKQLEKLLESDDCNDFNTNYGHSNDFLLSDTLWLCQTVFSKSPYKLSSSRIILFTNTSDPHPDDDTKLHQAQVRAGDLSQAGIDLDLIHMGENFDVSLFYKELLQLAVGDNGDDYEVPNPCTSYEDMLTRVSRVAHKKRALCKVLFNLGNEVTLAVNLFNLVQKAKMPTKTFLDQATNEPIKSVTQYFDMETAEIVVPAEILKSQQFGEKNILFRTDEVQQLRNIVKPGMDLLGFKPASRVKFHHHIKPSSFIYPDETAIKGSRTLFAALLERCATKSVVPICYLTPRRNSTPQLVALLPQLEEINKKNEQRLPPGFHVIYLPYVDNIRKLEMKNSEKASDEQVAKARQIIEKLSFHYHPSSFDNPKLQTMWSNIEALALDHSEPREVPDYTLPNHQVMKKRVGDLSHEFISLVYPYDYNPCTKKKPAAAKRAAKPAAAPAPKVPKTDLLSDDEMADLVERNLVNKLTINQLKNYLASKYIPGLSGKKKESLVVMVEHYVKNGTSV